LQFENIVKKATRVQITYEDGSKYFGDVAVDIFYGFLRHGDGCLHDSENCLLSQGRYYQNEWVPEPDAEKHCHNDNGPVICINRHDGYGFGTFRSSSAILPTICECCAENHCDASDHFKNMKYAKISHLAGVKCTTRNEYNEMEFHLLVMFGKAYGGGRSVGGIIVSDDFYDGPWIRATMFHNLFNRKTIRDRVIADFKVVVNLREGL